MADPRFPLGWLQRRVAISVKALSRIPAAYGGTASAALRPPMTEAAITDVIEVSSPRFGGASQA